MKWHAQNAAQVEWLSTQKTLRALRLTLLNFSTIINLHLVQLERCSELILDGIFIAECVADLPAHLEVIAFNRCILDHVKFQSTSVKKCYSSNSWVDCDLSAHLPNIEILSIDGGLVPSGCLKSLKHLTEINLRNFRVCTWNDNLLAKIHVLGSNALHLVPPSVINLKKLKLSEGPPICMQNLYNITSTWQNLRIIVADNQSLVFPHGSVITKGKVVLVMYGRTLKDVFEDVIMARSPKQKRVRSPSKYFYCRSTFFL
jgi:hypothetical protein